MKFLLMPYKKGSKSAGALSKALGIRQVRLLRSTLRGSERITLINWGSSDYHDNEEFEKCRIINPPEITAHFSNKLTFFQETDPDLCVPWTNDEEVVKGWLGGGKSVFARTVLNGHSGVGIVEMTPDNIDEWVKAPLYTQYIPKESEYRIHFLRRKVIDKQRKGLRQDVENEQRDPNVWKIRNLANGFVFVRNFGDCPKAVDDVVQKFILNAPLDFGAIDIIYNKKQDRAFILEVNTAPGLVGATVDSYVNGFREIMA